MPNSLGTLSENQIADDQPEVTGQRYAGTAALPASPSTRPEPLLVGSGHGAELQRQMVAKMANRPPEHYSAQEVETLFKDAEAGLARLEKNRGKVDPGPLIAQIRSELLGPLCGEFIQLKRLETRKILEAMMRPQWRRQVGTINLNLFEAVSAARILAGEVSTASQETFPGVARRVLEILRASWPKDGFPSPDPVCQAGGS